MARLCNAPEPRVADGGFLSMHDMPGSASPDLPPEPGTARAAMGPVMANPSAADLTARCDTYLGLVDIQRTALANDTARATVENTLTRYDDMAAMLSATQSEFALYQEVLLTAELRDVAAQCEVRASAVRSEISLSRAIYDRLKAVDVSEADDETRAYHRDILDEYDRSGVGLDDAGRDRMAAINRELSEISIALARNVAEDDRTLRVTEDELAGLPQDFLDAHAADADGRIALTTASTDYRPVMSYADSDDLRRRYQELYLRRAWPENDALLRRLFALRQEKAELLGRENYAALNLEGKMLDRPERVRALIEQTAQAARPVAKRDYERSLSVLKDQRPDADRIEPWQTAWIAPRVQKRLYDYDPQEARQYFRYDRVRDGVMRLTERLFGVSVVEWDTDLWHQDVDAFEMIEDGKVIGRFYLDSHPRPGKYTHANHIGLYPGSEEQPPVSAIVQNLPKGLMEHGQVETFLHEFGHGLHAIFGSSHRWTGQRYSAVERDFIEAPSQMLENWVYDYATLATFAVNDAGETIPRDLVERMNAARYFNKGLHELTQLGYANVALNFYSQPVPDDLGEATRRWIDEYALIPQPDYSQMQAAFGHLDGYGASYYTYGWSRIISEDLFARFTAEGLDNPQVAADYRRMVLQPGGTRPAAQLLRDFLGRDVTLDAFRADMERGLAG
ncbi:M3 family metallopeptidase [Aurantiacibacter spongiae]|uniref:Tetraacyldisaccharide 4'-kinase n=1 Tax=Aurantiacibacter spongiae TaxID=2488860 RepID=A0A3N5CMW1_9SPHN|nr:M3 family metallopeptidase [Aurantiacibacter spongiae]RPF70274.1 tetraacyldisaccharide 4'-kinase [Aurantiacibacter spongiae]